MKNHPAADAFPMMDAKRYAELVDDIRKNGQLEPVTVCEGMILDGRNRYKACIELGIEPETREYDGDPWERAWSLNGMRRDLVAEQRYLIWKHCTENSAKMQAEKKRIAEEANRKRSEAAKAQHETSKPKVGEKMKEWLPDTPCPKCGCEMYEMQMDRKICRRCGLVARALVGGQSVRAPKAKDPQRKAAARLSKTNAGAVARGDRLYKDRPDLAEKVMKGEVRPAEAHRLMKRDQVAKAVPAPSGKYRVIYADPPWSYNDKQGGEISESYGGAEKHYPSMTLSELKALDIPSIAADNCVLWMWATCPLLEDALELVKAWGFKYKAQFVWDKIKHNMGHYNSVRHELLLICTKGSATPENVKLFDSVQSIERTEHSKKPEEFRDIINTLYPSGKKIELFRRGDAPSGWSVWGNEVQGE